MRTRAVGARRGQFPGAATVDWAWLFPGKRSETQIPWFNSRTAYSRLALQTRDLHETKANFAGIWGDFGGTLEGRVNLAERARASDPCITKS